MLLAIAPARAAKNPQSQFGDFSQHKTFGAAGKEFTLFGGGKENDLWSYQGHGCMTHMWFGGSWNGYGDTRLRVYVDGETTASIDMTLDMSIGVGFGDDSAPWGVPQIGKTGSPSGIYNSFKIPFGKSIRVTATLSDPAMGNQVFWYIMRGSSNIPVTIAGVTLPDAARLHLYKRENYTVQRLEEFDLVNTKHSGALYMVALSAKSSNQNYLESIMRAYIDGATEPMDLSSGMEDYFCGTYYFNRGKYYTPVAGCTHVNEGDATFSGYRFHDQDPVFFQTGLRLTARCGEQIPAHVCGDPQATTFTTYAWVYEW
jgi:hypothetical protein